MYYGKWITITKNTTAATAEVTLFKMWRGVVHNVLVYFPTGHKGLTHVKVDHGAIQLWPSYPNEWFSGDDVVYDFKEYLSLEHETNTFRVSCYNEDEAYDHKVFVAFAMMSADELDPQKSFFEKFTMFVRRLGL